MARRFATAFVVALLVSVIAIPAVGACCVAKQANRLAAMHASMPCCTQHCTLSNTNTARDRDSAVLSTPSQTTVAVTTTAIAAVPSPGHAPINTIDGQWSSEFTPPPPFLLHSQFRI